MTVRVNDMSSTKVSVFFDDEDNDNEDVSCTGAHPYDTGCGGRHHHLHNVPLYKLTDFASY